MTNTVENIGRDLRYAMRKLSRSAGFSLITVAILTVGTAISAAIFHLLLTITFPRLPVPHADELYVLHILPTPNDESWLYSQPAFEHLASAAEHQQEGVSIGAHASIVDAKMLVPNGQVTTRVSAQLVSSNFFSVLGVSSRLGRPLMKGDERQSARGWPAVLEYGFWRHNFSSDPSIIGQSIHINGALVSVVGVAPETFYGVIQGEIPDLWLPLEAQYDIHYSGPFDSLGRASGVKLSDPYMHQASLFWVTLIGRFPKNAEARALANLDSAFVPDRELYRTFGPPEMRRRADRSHTLIFPIAADESGLLSFRVYVFVLFGMVAGLLLMACVNLASLQRARMIERTHEFAIKISLGAGRKQLIQQFGMESALLASIVAPLSLLFIRIVEWAILRWTMIGAGVLQLQFTAAVYIGAGATVLLLIVLAYVFPATGMLSIDIHPHYALASTSGRMTGAKNKTTTLLLGMQISLSILLLNVAFLLSATLVNLKRVDAGFDRDHILTARLDLQTGIFDGQRAAALYPHILERIAALPGVRSAAVDACPPPNCLWNSQVYPVVSSFGEGPLIEAGQNNVGPGYFRTMGMTLLAGREFATQDRPNTLKVAIVNQAFARLLNPVDSPIGKQFQLSPSSGPEYMVVGEISDARLHNLREVPKPMIYLSVDQNALDRGGLQVRTVGKPADLTSAVMSAIRSIDSQFPIVDISPLQNDYAETLRAEKLTASIAALFAGVSLFIVGIGLYGVLSYRVSRRAKEFGVRMAMGARRHNIVALVLVQVLLVFAAGALVGAVLAFACARSLHTLLYGTMTGGFMSTMVAIAGLGVTMMMAALVPIRRAMSIEPLRALNLE